MKQASSAGCRALYLGVESLNQKTRKKLGKQKDTLTENEISDIFRKMKKYHIEPLVSLIVGGDEDTIESTEHLIDFMIGNFIGGIYLFILTPFPSTGLRAKLEKEGRVVCDDWSKYDSSHCVFTPTNFSTQELEDMFWRCQQKFYGVSSILHRYAIPRRTGLLGHNLVYREIVNSKTHPMMGIREKSILASAFSFSSLAMNSTFLRKMFKVSGL